MADAAAPQNSISTGTSMRMSIKVKYVLWRVLKDALQDPETTGGGRKEKKKKHARGRQGEEERRGKMKIMCLRSAVSHHHPTGTQRGPTLTTDCE